MITMGYGLISLIITMGLGIELTPIETPVIYTYPNPSVELVFTPIAEPIEFKEIK